MRVCTTKASHVVRDSQQEVSMWENFGDRVAKNQDQDPSSRIKTGLNGTDSFFVKAAYQTQCITDAAYKSATMEGKEVLIDMSEIH